MASRKRIYDAEFREGAVRIVTETGKPIPEVAEDLGIHPGTLHSWVSRARRNGSPSSDRPLAEPSAGRLRESERAELAGCGPRRGRRTSASASWRWSVMCASDSPWRMVGASCGTPDSGYNPVLAPAQGLPRTASVPPRPT
ncbi:transposase [Streptomyces sp. NPDC052043]|uniref:transposase n=2 Tax=unclassified Streptomyces TaxID=2593676 RepID=UPI0037CCDB4F